MRLFSNTHNSILLPNKTEKKGQYHNYVIWLFLGITGLTMFYSINSKYSNRLLFNFILDGVETTLVLTCISFLCILVIGIFIGLGRNSTNRFIFLISSAYVELVRGIPLLVQLIWWYFAFPIVLRQVGELFHLSTLQNLSMDPIIAAITGLVIGYSSFMGEIYRAGIQSIPVGQMEAALSTGMNKRQAYRYVILPQAIRIIFPTIGNEFISLLKDSSLVSVVAVADLTRRGHEYMSIHFNPLEVWSMVTLIYIILTLFSATFFSWIESLLRIPK